MGALFAVLRIADGTGSPRLWLLFGLLGGVGVENKHSTVFFLAALLIGLLVSPQRRILLTRDCLAGVTLLALLALPNFLWQWDHQFATYRMLSAVAHSDKNLKLPPLRFIWEQINILLYTTAPLWIGGIVWLAFAQRSRPWRFAAYTYLVFLTTMMVLHAKDYYLAPIYPFLFAAGAAALGDYIRRDRTLVIIGGQYLFGLIFFTGPITLSVLPPKTYLVYTAPFAPTSSRSEKYTSPLPQILSDRFGWPQMVQGFATRYQALPSDIRASTGIICTNYGEASAVNILGQQYGLPTAISGHQNYYLWGWNGYTGDSMLTLGKDAGDYTDQYEQVVDLGVLENPWAMDFEHNLHYFWLRHRKVPLRGRLAHPQILGMSRKSALGLVSLFAQKRLQSVHLSFPLRPSRLDPPACNFQACRLNAATPHPACLLCFHQSCFLKNLQVLHNSSQGHLERLSKG